ncbi:MAG TPA: alpha/beta hydrolase, partial [Burkholderiaceae bacterium]|nr:alpha/beta hydrolase [Burkholderiaceae bacterium]
MTAEPRLNHVQCLGARGLRRMAYWEWGDAANPRVLVCVHGLARQGRDFDTLARALSDAYRVVCPDVVGRGQSDWLTDPSGYQIPAYVADMVTLLARLNAPTVHWVGTSMGGLIGLFLASLPQSPIGKLVINDVGPVVQFEALVRIGNYLGQPLRWNTLDEATDYLQTISTSFGPHTRAQWLAFSRPMLKADGDGFKLHYDPAIAQPFKAITPEIAAAGEAMTWAAFDAIKCPTL